MGERKNDNQKIKKESKERRKEKQIVKRGNGEEI